MAKFDVYPDGEGEYLLDCQADMLSALNSRFVVPLRTTQAHDASDRRLNPRFMLDGHELVMLTHFATAIPAKILRHPVGSFAEHEYEIGRTLNLLIGRY